MNATKQNLELFMVYCVVWAEDVKRRDGSAEGGCFSFFFRMYYMGVSAGPSTLINKSLFPFFLFPPLSSINVSLLLPIRCFCSWFMVCKFLHSGWRREEVASLSFCDVVRLKLFRSLHLSTISFQSTSPSELISFCFLFNIHWCILDININQVDQTSWQRTLDYPTKNHRKESKSFYSKWVTKTSVFWTVGFMFFLWISSYSIYS